MSELQTTIFHHFFFIYSNHERFVIRSSVIICTYLQSYFSLIEFPERNNINIGILLIVQSFSCPCICFLKAPSFLIHLVFSSFVFSFIDISVDINIYNLGHGICGFEIMHVFYQFIPFEFTLSIICVYSTNQSSSSIGILDDARYMFVIIHLFSRSLMLKSIVRNYCSTMSIVLVLGLLYFIHLIFFYNC